MSRNNRCVAAGVPLLGKNLLTLPASVVGATFGSDLTASGLKPLPIPAQLSPTFSLGAGGDRDFAVLLSGQLAAPAKNTNATELVERLAAETTQRLRVA